MGGLRILALIGALSFFLGGASLHFFGSFCAAAQGKGKVVILESELMSEGYVLLSPYIGESFYAEPGTVKLIDEKGRSVHSWRTTYQVLHAILRPDGSLFVSMVVPDDLSRYPGGKTGLIQELDWGGNVLWEFADQLMNHDFDVLPDDAVAYLQWEELPSSFTRLIRGGALHSNEKPLSERIVVVDSSGTVVWEWSLYEHVNPTDYVLSPLVPRADWSHSNSLEYVEKNPFTYTPAFILSARHINAVFLIEMSTGAILWESPPGILSFQHDARLTEAGTILIFDNGTFREQERPLLWSRVVEINPKTNQRVWQYDGGKTGSEKATFFSSIEGGIQRLSNGNTLVTLSTRGELLEITKEGSVVWRYLHEPGTNERAHLIFKARKYDPRGTAWEREVAATYCGL